MYTTFIIDDDTYAVDVVEMMFDWNELNVDHIEKIYSPDGLVDRISSEKPHICFIDIELYDVSGLDIIAECRKQNSDTLFIIISGHDDFQYARDAVALDVLYYLLKPIDTDDVEAVTKKLQKALINLSKPKETNTDADVILPGETDELWRKIQTYIEENYQKKLNVQDICSYFYISQRVFFKTFKRNTDETFIEYLTRVRINRAKELLLTTSKTLPEIADAVGIGDYYYFSKIFKKVTGTAPLKFRKCGGVSDV